MSEGIKAQNTQETSEEKIARLERENTDLKAKNEALEIAHEEILEQLRESLVDKLTGMRRRDVFEMEVRDYMMVSDEPENPEGHKRKSLEMPTISLLLFDLDNFKTINDTHGHNTGNLVLESVARIIREHTRDYDISGRWGGDELALAMIGSSEDEAEVKARFIKNKIENLKFDGYLDLGVSISIGVASSRKFKKFEELFNATDRALYASKHSGRNTVTAFSKLPKSE